MQVRRDKFHLSGQLFLLDRMKFLPEIHTMNLVLEISTNPGDKQLCWFSLQDILMKKIKNMHKDLQTRMVMSALFIMGP